MEEFALLSPLLITVAGLLIGAILKSLLKHSNFPYTVALFVLGLGIGLLDRAGFLQAFPDVSKDGQRMLSVHFHLSSFEQRMVPIH